MHIFTFETRMLRDAFKGIDQLSPGSIGRIEINHATGVAAVRLTVDANEDQVRHALRCIGDDGAFVASTLRKV